MRLLPEYLVSLMGSPHGRWYFQLTAKRTTNLASDELRHPRDIPYLSAQVATSTRRDRRDVDRPVRPLDTAVKRAHREIGLLHEYRTRLIADVVTGKLDVREAAAALPEVDPLTKDDEPDDVLDNETEADLDDMDAIPEEDVA